MCKHMQAQTAAGAVHLLGSIEVLVKLVGTQELEDCIGVVFQVTIDCAFVEVEIGVLALSIEV